MVVDCGLLSTVRLAKGKSTDAGLCEWSRHHRRVKRDHSVRISGNVRVRDGLPRFVCSLGCLFADAAKQWVSLNHQERRERLAGSVKASSRAGRGCFGKSPAVAAA